MARDDHRMHDGNTPGLVPGRGHERHEEPARLDRPEPGSPASAATGDAALPKGARSAPDHQESALGGDVAARSGTIATPDDTDALCVPPDADYKGVIAPDRDGT